MLEYNEITPRKFILLDGAPHEVLASHVFRKQQRKPVNQTKLRNLLSGAVVERSFHQSEKADEADLSTRDIKYIFNKRGEYWFNEPNDPTKRFSLPSSIVGPQGDFLPPNTIVEALVFNDEIIGLKLPIKVELRVTEAPPAVRGNTAQGATKQITLETGAIVNAPLFINEGDLVRINTETSQYVERVEKR